MSQSPVLPIRGHGLPRHKADAQLKLTSVVWFLEVTAAFSVFLGKKSAKSRIGSCGVMVQFLPQISFKEEYHRSIFWLHSCVVPDSYKDWQSLVDTSNDKIFEEFFRDS